MIHPIQSLPEVQRLERLATRSTTPCGPDGSMVWRRWAKDPAEGSGALRSNGPPGSNGPPVVLLHGGSGAWNHWIKNIEVLAQSHTVWAPDLPGCGESALPPGATDADSIFETVAAGIAECAKGTPVDLIGFSFGSMVAGFVAAYHPHLVRRLVLIAPPALGLRAAPLGLKSLGIPMTPEQQEQAIRHNLQRMMLHDPAAVDDLAVALHADNVAHDRLRKRRISRGVIMTRLQTRWRCPVHVICGREDPLAKEELQRLPEVLNQCDLREVLLVDHTGHWVQYEQPALFQEAAARILGQS